MKVAISLCPNDIFIYSGLILNKIPNSICFDILDITNLNKMLSSSSYDFIKVSSLTLLKSEEYKVTKVGASLARYKGPQLAKKCGGSPTGSIVGVPSLHSTATRLSMKYFPHLKPREYPLKDITATLVAGGLPYAIILNEDINRLEELGLESVCDLGLRWNREFNAFLPLGVVASRRNIPDSDVEYFEELVSLSLEWANKNLDQAVGLTQEYAGKKDINSDHIKLFTQDAYRNPDISKIGRAHV